MISLSDINPWFITSYDVGTEVSSFAEFLIQCSVQFSNMILFLVATLQYQYKFCNNVFLFIVTKCFHKQVIGLQQFFKLKTKFDAGPLLFTVCHLHRFKKIIAKLKHYVTKMQKFQELSVTSVGTLIYKGIVQPLYQMILSLLKCKTFNSHCHSHWILSVIDPLLLSIWLQLGTSLTLQVTKTWKPILCHTGFSFWHWQSATFPI